MEGVAKILYEQFFMRDALGKVAPGFIVLTATALVLNIELLTLIPTNRIDGPWLLVIYVVILPTCYVAGLGLQICGENVGLHSPSPRPLGFLLIRSKLSRDAYSEHRDRLVIINTDERLEKTRKDIKSQRERFVYLKEGAGNFALALLVLAICLWFKREAFDRDVGLLIFGFIVLEVAHYVCAARQARFEICALYKAKILMEHCARSMALKIPKWTGERAGIDLPAG